MPKLFGLDIAKLVDDGLAAAGGVLTGTLERTTTGARTSDDLLAGPSRSTTSYPFRGLLDNRDEVRDGSTLVRQGGRYATILGASLPAGITPQAGDRITIEGETYDVIGIPERDPAAATYTCRVSQ